MAKLLTAFILGACLLGVHRTDAKPIAVTPGEQVNLTLKLVNVNEQPLKQVTVEWDRTSLPPWGLLSPGEFRVHCLAVKTSGQALWMKSARSATTRCARETLSSPALTCPTMMMSRVWVS